MIPIVEKHRQESILKKALAEARNQALEEAAKAAEVPLAPTEYALRVSATIAARIRSLKTNETKEGGG